MMAVRQEADATFDDAREFPTLRKASQMHGRLVRKSLLERFLIAAD
jgi:Rad3-related DNA helicase